MMIGEGELPTLKDNGRKRKKNYMNTYCNSQKNS